MKKHLLKKSIVIICISLLLTGSIILFYQHSRNFYWLWLLPGIMLTAGWALLVYLFLKRNKSRMKRFNKNQNYAVVLMILLIMVTVHSVLIRWVGRSYYEKVLTEGATLTITAKVIDISSKYAYRWENKSWAVFEYKVDNEVLIKPIRNYNNEFEMGQEIDVLVSLKHPKIVRVQ